LLLVIRLLLVWWLLVGRRVWLVRPALPALRVWRVPRVWRVRLVLRLRWLLVLFRRVMRVRLRL
jgi:hypothetical protein